MSYFILVHKKYKMPLGENKKNVPQAGKFTLYSCNGVTVKYKIKAKSTKYAIYTEEYKQCTDNSKHKNAQVNVPQ